MVGLCLVGTLADGVCGQELGGRVIDARSGEPIPFANIWIVGRGGEVLRQTDATAEGAFSILVGELLPDTVFLSVEAFGYYSVYEGPFGREDVEDARVDVALRPMAVAIAGIDVAVDARVPKLERMGFYRRREHSSGYFLDAKAIEQRKAANQVHHLLAGAVPGVRVTNEGDVYLRGTLGLRRECDNPKLYLDGIRIHDPLWSRMGLHSIAGIEVYRSPSQIPVQFGGADAACGVVLIWTHDGSR